MRKVVETDQLVALQQAADAVYVDPALIEYAVKLVSATRDPKAIGLATSAGYVLLRRQPAGLDQPDPRGAGARVRPGPRLRAPQDVYDLALDVIRHRLVLSYEALADGVSADDLLCSSWPPSPSPRSRSMSAPPSPSPTMPVARPAAPEQLLQRLDWQVIRRLDGLLQGDYRTLFYGAGVDFADLREYQPDDDVRHIDWNVTARMDTPYVRQYVDDRELTAWLLLDRSPSMSFGRVDRPKELVLTELVTTLARLLTRSGNRVGAILYDNAVERTIPPRGGRNQVLRLARDLLRPPANTGAATDLSGLIHAGLNTIKRRSLVFVVSDFISEPGWERPLALLGHRHEVVAIRLWDPREVELPDAGVVVMQDAETGEQLFVDTSDPAFRRRFHDVAEARQEQLRTSVKRGGADLYDLSTDDDLVLALLRMIVHRKRRRR